MLVIYVRTLIPIDDPPEKILVKLIFPWEADTREFSIADSEKIRAACAQAKEKGNPATSFVTKLTATPFEVKSVGRVEVYVSFDNDEVLAG